MLRARGLNLAACDSIYTKRKKDKKGHCKGYCENQAIVTVFMMSWTEPSIVASLLCTRSLEFVTTRGGVGIFGFFGFGHCLARFFGFCVCYGFRFFLILALLSMQIKFFPIVCQPQIFLFPWVSRTTFFSQMLDIVLRIFCGWTY